MIITISLSESDLKRIKDVMGITDYNDIHKAIVKTFGELLDKIESLSE